ncbi:MAG: hypothetical protein ISR64_07085 [Deltaproteobacteria bacterium]|nr:hypothetical protein [Deltaproteobacteria bacterium]
MRLGLITLVACLMVLAAGWGCADEDPSEKVLVASFKSLVQALKNRDTSTLWNLSDGPTQLYFSDLAAEIKDAVTLIDQHYAPADREKAKRAVGGGLVKTTSSGQDLFKVLMDPEKMSLPGNPEALQVDNVVVGAYTATVVTRAGKSIEFTMGDDGGFRTGVFMEEFLEQPALHTLQENLAIARQNCRVLALGAPGPNPAEVAQ